MGHLDKLKVSKRVIAAARPRRKTDTKEYRREKLVANIEEQIELANLALQGKPLQLHRKRGHGVVTVRPRIWWKVAPDGLVFTQIRYNKVALNLAGRGNTIEVGALKKLPAVYRKVIKATKAGELDRAIESAARKSRP
ncbi:MAG: hypothetical protein OEM59_15440 [Rhodospirillales bacterium]|nr:hypothetical protein [Rhodospirillales bacterium]